VRRLSRLPHGAAHRERRLPRERGEHPHDMPPVPHGRADNFVDVQMHVAPGPIPNDPRLRVITIWMLTLLIGTFGFFAT